MARILIAGCGLVGTRLGVELAVEGHEVWGLRRNPESLPQAIHGLCADLTVPGSLASLPENLDRVFFTAAPDRHDDEAYRTLYGDGVRILLQCLVEQGQQPQRVLFTSSTAVYEQKDGEWIDEDSPTQPCGYAGQRLLEAERLLAGGPFPSVVVRLAGIYGPERARLVDTVRNGAAAYADGPPRYTNRIHHDDCAGVLRYLAFLDDPDPLYLASDDEPADDRTILTWLAGQLGAPEPAIRPAAELSSWTRGSNKRCCNRKLRQSGYRFRFPTFRDGYGAMLS